VRALGKDAKHARLYELVDIFAHATLGAYLEYHGKNSAYLADLGIDHERSMETMRLLTLCTLASGNHKQTYDAIAAALQVRVWGVCFCVCARSRACVCVRACHRV
jgi:hypothetical protein